MHTIDHILETFYTFTPLQKVYILQEALVIMEETHKSKEYCIAIAMGYSNDEGYRDTYYK